MYEQCKFYVNRLNETTVFFEHNNHNQIRKIVFALQYVQRTKITNPNSNWKNNLCVTMHEDHKLQK